MNKMIFILVIAVLISFLSFLPNDAHAQQSYELEGGLSASSLNGLHGGSVDNSATPAKFHNFAEWEKYIAKVPVPHAGCFNVKYPNMVWQQTRCTTAPLVPLQPSHAPTTGNKGQPLTVGNGNDWSAVAPPGQLIQSSTGTFVGSVFPSETDSLIGIQHPNEFSLQINSQQFGPVSTSYTDFKPNYGNSWEQFVMANDPYGFYGFFGGAQIYIQYWLIGFAHNNGGHCPSNGPPGGSFWMISGNDCFANSPATTIPIQTVSNLVNVKFAGMTQLGQDEVIFCDTLVQYCRVASVTDQVVNLSPNWQSAEFNIFGFANGSQAIFNPGASITVTNTVVTNYSADLPLTCMKTGFTAETNNLNIIPYDYGNPTGSLDYCSTNTNGETVFIETNGPTPNVSTLTTGTFVASSGNSVASGVMGSFNPDCSSGCLFPVGQSITVTATPSTGYQLVLLSPSGFSPQCSTNSCTFSMPSTPVYLDAFFAVLESVAISCPAHLDVVLGSSGSIACTITSQNGFSGSVSLSTAEPNILTFLPDQLDHKTVTLTPTQNAIVNLTVTPSAFGKYSVTLFGQYNTWNNQFYAHSNTIDFNVIPATLSVSYSSPYPSVFYNSHNPSLSYNSHNPSLSYSSPSPFLTLCFSPNGTKIPYPQTAWYPEDPHITLDFRQNFDSMVNWSVTPPSGSTITPSKGSLNLPANYDQSAVTTISFDPSLSSGTYVISLRASDGILTKNIFIPLIYDRNSPCVGMFPEGSGNQVNPSSIGSLNPSSNSKASIAKQISMKSVMPKSVHLTPLSPSPLVPSWVKKTGDWWSKGQVSDNEFMKLILYLNDNKLITIPHTTFSATTIVHTNEHIPAWVKTTSGLWANGKVSDREFLSSMQYLANTGVIKFGTK